MKQSLHCKAGGCSEGLSSKLSASPVRLALQRNHSWRVTRHAASTVGVSSSNSADGERYRVTQDRLDVESTSAHAHEQATDTSEVACALSPIYLPELEADWWGPGWIPSGKDDSVAVATVAVSSGPDEQWQHNLFEVLQTAHIDAQSAAYLLSQLAMRNAIWDPLSPPEMARVLRIADTTGLTLPPGLAAQLRDLVSTPGHRTAVRSSAPLLTAFQHDLPALLEALEAQGVRPSLPWADAALRGWLAHAGLRATAAAAAASGGGGAFIAGDASGATPFELSVFDVRAAMERLEAVFQMPADASAGPALLVPPPAPLPLSTTSSAAATLLFPPPLPGFPPSSSSPSSFSSTSPSSSQELQQEQQHPAALPPPPLDDAPAYLRSWLDACLEALLDGGALAAPHQREDLYGMLPYLATVPSAAMVERLYDMAWPPYPFGTWAASPEATAGLLCACAASGARLPPGALQRELSALEQMLLLMAPPTAGVSPAAFGYQRPHSARGMGGGAGAGGGGGFLFPTSSASSATAVNRAAASDGPRKLSAHGAFLSLAALHQHSHVPAAAAHQAALGGVLLAAMLSEPAQLGASHRCRALRALLRCLPASHPRLLLLLLTSPSSSPSSSAASVDRDLAPLLAGWEQLPAAELLGLLDEAAAAARSAASASAAVRHAPAAPSLSQEQQALGIVNLAAYVVQLPGWPERLASSAVGLAAVTRSIRSLLDVLVAVGLRPHACAGEEGEELLLGTGGNADGSADGGGGALRAAAQELLAAWLEIVLPAVEGGVRDAADCGDGTEQASLMSQPTALSLLSQSSPSGAGAEAVFSIDVLDGFFSTAAPAQSPPSSVCASVTAAPPPRALALTAAELTAALASLHDAAAALDARSHQALHRALLWALQRLGSRAARCVPAPEEFPHVPELLMQIDSLACVDVPLEWAHAVVSHADADTGCNADPRVAPRWFRSLAWQDALCTAVAAGQLVQRARSEVLRRDGLLVAEEPAIAAATADGPVEGASVATAPQPASPSRARALLAATQALRSHVVGLLAARAAAAGLGELREAAVAWQTYRVPYDRAATAALLCALATAAAAAAAVDGGGGAGPVRGPARDAAQRLWAVCLEWQVAPWEVDELFAAF